MKYVQTHCKQNVILLNINKEMSNEINTENQEYSKGLDKTAHTKLQTTGTTRNTQTMTTLYGRN